MVCQFCSMTVEKTIKKVTGIKAATVDFKQKTATVQFDPAKTGPATVTRAVTEAGFPAAVRRHVR